MWIYEKKLQYPVRITSPDPRMAKLLLAQYAGPDSELGAGLRYLTQRYSMPDNRCYAALTDIGTEELAHWEMIATMIFQCLKDASIDAIKAAGIDGYYVMHGKGIFPVNPDGVPFTSAYMQYTGDPIADLHEDLAAEQKARVTYEHLMRIHAIWAQARHRTMPPVLRVIHGYHHQALFHTVFLLALACAICPLPFPTGQGCVNDKPPTCRGPMP